jgi:hypothetical protein
VDHVDVVKSLIYLRDFVKVKTMIDFRYLVLSYPFGWNVRRARSELCDPAHALALLCGGLKKQG